MMQCRFCSSHNLEDEERCQRCGKRLSEDTTFEGFSMAGATALAPRRRYSVLDDSAEIAGAAMPRRMARAAAASADRPTSLVISESSPKIIPFESIQRPGVNGAAQLELIQNLDPGPTTRALESTKPVIRKQPPHRRQPGRRADDSQGMLDLETLQPAAQAPRTLKTTVEARIYCDAEVATPMHRSLATVFDAAMIFIGCGVFLGMFQTLVQHFGGDFHFNRFNEMVFGGALLLITAFYGLIFAICGRETVGQNCAQLRLINFDGFPPEGTNRALRYLGGWLSIGAGGIGLVWALVDEENLTWHDHMSKTFLTVREPESSLVRERN